MVTDINIVKVSVSDVAALQKISTTTFVEAFATVNTDANMKKYLEENLSKTKLIKELKDVCSHFYFAMLHDRAVGYLKINVDAAQTELKDAHAVEIERIYVLQAYYGQGVGQHLCDYAIQIARQRHAQFIWLGVWEKNPRAIKFYSKYGFTPFDSHTFLLGDDTQTDIMMRLQL